MSRIDYLWNVLGVLDGVRDRTHRREILEIAIAADAARLAVESREFDAATINGIRSEVTARSSDIVELRDGAVTIARSTKKIESRHETRVGP